MSVAAVRAFNAQGMIVPKNASQADRLLDRIQERLDRGHVLPSDKIVLAKVRSALIQSAEQEIAQALGLN